MSRGAISTAAAVILGVAVRLVALDADPPAWHGLGFLSDEGWWAQNARNRVLFGSFVIPEPRDEFNQGLVLSPTFTLLSWASFAAFGPSLWSLRLVSALMSGVTAVALARVARELLGSESGPVAAVLYLFSPFAWAFGRVGLVEETMNAFLALMLAAWVGRGLAPGVLAGLAHAAAFGTKSYAVFAGVAILASVLIPPADAEPWRARGRKLVGYGVGLGLGLGIWAAAIYQPYRADYRELNLKLSQDNLPRSPAVALRNAADLLLEIGPGGADVATWIRLAPVLATLAVLGMSGIALGSIAALRRDRAVVLAVPLLGVYAALLAPMQYKPDRRYGALLLGEVLLACWACRHIPALQVPLGTARRLAAALPLALLAAAVPASLLGATRTKAAVAYVAATAVLVPLIAAVLPGVFRILRGLAVLPATAAIAAFAAVVGMEMARVSFTMVREGEQLSAIVGSEPVLGGVAGTLLLPSRAMVFNSMRRGTSGRFNADIAVRAGVRWVVTWTQPERSFAVEDAPVPGTLHKVRETPILPSPGGGSRATVTLWRHDPPATP